MSPQHQTAKRVAFIDLLRGWAVIVMIETHVVNGTLAAGVTAGDPFQILKFLNGLVAPSFLFASGLAYAITTRRKLNDYLSFGKPLFKQIGRLLFILFIGYCLHIPKFNYVHLRYVAGEDAWQKFYQADVLQCIAVSLLFLQLLLLLLRTERRMYLALFGCTIAVVFASPLIWGIDFWNLLPVPLAAYLNGLHYSLFPLFPWSGFLFAGAITGYFYVQARETPRAEGSPGREPAMMKSAVWIGLALIVVSFAFEPIGVAVYTTYDYWRFSPSFSMLRLGLVLLLCGGMFLFEHIRGVSVNSPITLIGRESLLVYSTHLLLIYGHFGSFSFQEKVQNSFGYTEALITTLVLLVLMYVLALVWSRVKLHQRQKLIIQLVTLALFLGVFFWGPSN